MEACKAKPEALATAEGPTPLFARFILDFGFWIFLKGRKAGLQPVAFLSAILSTVASCHPKL
jgi:hypothetical protein